MFEYQGRVERIVDGDTIDFSIDLGFHIYFREKMRLADYAAPEIDGVEKPLGDLAKQKLEELLPVGTIVVLRSKKTDKYGRWLAEVVWENSTLGNYLIAQGYGVAWNGVGPCPVFEPNTPYPLTPNK